MIRKFMMELMRVDYYVATLVINFLLLKGAVPRIPWNCWQFHVWPCIWCHFPPSRAREVQSQMVGRPASKFRVFACVSVRQNISSQNGLPAEKLHVIFFIVGNVSFFCYLYTYMDMLRVHNIQGGVHVGLQSWVCKTVYSWIIY